MNKINFHNYWATKKSSLNRGSDHHYYAFKAQEHAALLKQAPLDLGLVDFGCGAGELLQELAPLLSCEILALDFSAQLLAEAKKRNPGKNIRFLESHAIDYAESDFGSCWMSCGAVNQYSSASEMKGFLDKFRLDPQARALYFFDCIDPMHYMMLKSGLSQGFQGGTTKNRIKLLVRLMRYLKWHLLWLSQQKEVYALGTMGYGFAYTFWHHYQQVYPELKLQIISSWMFEYRYHVIIRK